jgi:hypothetical protein
MSPAAESNAPTWAMADAWVLAAITNDRPVGFNYYAKGLSWDAVRSSSISTA